jgi:hypothetical protein
MLLIDELEADAREAHGVRVLVRMLKVLNLESASKRTFGNRHIGVANASEAKGIPDFVR